MKHLDVAVGGRKGQRSRLQVESG